MNGDEVNIYNQIIDEVYENYLKNWKPQPVVENELHWMEQELVSDRPLPKDMFIHFSVKQQKKILRSL